MGTCQTRRTKMKGPSIRVQKNQSVCACVKHQGFGNSLVQSRVQNEMHFFFLGGGVEPPFPLPIWDLSQCNCFCARDQCVHFVVWFSACSTRVELRSGAIPFSIISRAVQYSTEKYTPPPPQLSKRQPMLLTQACFRLVESKHWSTSSKI